MGCVPDPACRGGLVTSKTSVVTLALAQHHWTAEIEFVGRGSSLHIYIGVRPLQQDSM
jgi:hypothetical protein